MVPGLVQGSGTRVRDPIVRWLHDHTVSEALTNRPADGRKFSTKQPQYR